MGAFLDTGYIIALKNGSDSNHAAAMEIYEDLRTRVHGDVYTSDYILDETLTLALARSCRMEIVRDIEAFIRRTSWIKYIKVTDAEIEVAWNLFIKYFDKALSFTDCVTIAQTKSHVIEKMCTFDSRFAGIIATLP